MLEEVKNTWEEVIKGGREGCAIQEEWKERMEM